MDFLSRLAAMSGAIGISLLVFYSVYYYLGKKHNVIIPYELTNIPVIAGVCMHYFLLPGHSAAELIGGLAAFFMLTVLILPVRGISYHTKLPEDEILEKLRNSMTFTQDGPYIYNHKIHKLITADGVMILVKSLSRGKIREVSVICGFNLKKINKAAGEVLKALDHIVNQEEQNKNYFIILLMGAAFLAVYIISRVSGFIS